MFRRGELSSIRAVVVKRFQANNSNFCRSRARASLRDQPLALPAWDQQEETEQSDSRTDRGRALDTRVQSELVSSIVPRGTSLRWMRGGGDYAEPQYGRPVLSWFNSGLNGQGRPLAGLGRAPAGRV